MTAGVGRRVVVGANGNAEAFRLAALHQTARGAFNIAAGPEVDTCEDRARVAAASQVA